MDDSQQQPADAEPAPDAEPREAAGPPPLPTATDDKPPPLPETPPESRRILLGGCAAVFAVVALFLGTAWLILSSLSSGDEASDYGDDGFYSAEERARDGGGVLTQTERKKLRADLRKIENELELAKNQREVSFDLATRDSWQDRIDELDEQREDILARLRR